MSQRQFGFLLGFLIVWVWSTASFLTALAAIVAGLAGYGVIRVLEGSLNLGEFADRFSRSRQ